MKPIPALTVVSLLTVLLAAFWHRTPPASPPPAAPAHAAAAARAPRPSAIPTPGSVVAHPDPTARPTSDVPGTNAASTNSVVPDPFQAFDAWVDRLRLPAGASLNPSAESEGLRLARRRREELDELIRSDPRRALELAVPDSIRASLPASIAALLEERVAGRGDFEVLCALPEPGREAEVKPLTRYVRLEQRRFQANVYGKRLTQPTQRGISLTGIAIDGAMAVDERPVRELDPSVTQALLTQTRSAVCNEGADHPATHPLAVALEAYGKPLLFCCPDHASRFEARLAAVGTGTQSGDFGSTPLAQSPATEGLKRVIFIRVDFSDLEGEPFTTNRAVDLTKEIHRFYQENSYGRAGFVEIGSGSDVTPVFRMPRTASSYGSNDDAGDLRNDARQAALNAGYALDDYDYDITCIRNVPGFTWAGLGFVGGPGAWIRGTSSAGVTAHELGHNYGLNHANFWDTGGTSVTGPGENREYGDKFDTMGAASAGNNHFNARYKRLLGWLKTGEYSIATTNGTYRIYAHDQTNAVVGSRGLQIFSNARTNYWVEFRQRFAGNRWLFNGVGIRWAGRDNEASLLLDTTPDSPREKDDSAVTIGRTFSDLAAGVHITPIAKGGSNPAWMDVVVQRGPFPDNRPPSLELVSPVLQGTTATTFSFQAAASDPDGDPLAYFWEFEDESLGTNTPSLSHRWTDAGEYRVQCVASDMKGGTARASVIVRVGTFSTFHLSGRVTADGEPVNGARVTTAAGSVAFTDSDGTYTLTGVNAGTHTLTATLDTTSFEPATFTNRLTVNGNRSGLDFAAVDVAQRKPVTLLAAGSSWRYWDTGTSPGSAWFRAGFDDSTWDLGPAILGYGGDRETTVVDFGGDSNRKFITTWYRRTFVVEDPSRFTNLRIALLRDDGAVVYLNGTELFRENMPAGTITDQTPASSTVSGNSETTYFERDLDRSRLVAGTNLFAVAIHQSSGTSSDTAFDLRLTGDATQSTEAGIRLVRPAPDATFATPGRLILSAAVGELPTKPLKQVVFQADGRTIGIATNAPYIITWLNPPPGEHTLVASAVLPGDASVDSAPVVTTVRDAHLTPVLVPRGSIWRYLDTGVAPETSWSELSFNDEAWPQGPARLGYGEDGESTVISFGTNASLKHVTSWFRHTFDVLGARSVSNLICRIARDDGALVYLNGQELFRSGLRTGAISPTQLAQTDIRDDAEVTFAERTVSPAALVEGRNVLAVELHQVSRTSSDVGFDLELVAQRSSLPEAPRLGVRLTEGGLEFSWPGRFSGWRLEQSDALGSPSWTAVPGSPNTSGEQSIQSLPSPGSPVFYRLALPR